MRFASLGSGSRGNAVLIETANSRVMLDCGFSCREVEKRLAGLEVDPATIDAVLLSHEHSDHVRGAERFAGRWRTPMWMSFGTRLGVKFDAEAQLNLFHPDQGGFRIGDLEIQPFTVPHDAREPCQYRFCSGSLRLTVLTDLGCATPHILEMLDGLDALVLETNHDEQMLIDGPYHWPLKRRVGGDHGHLSNRQAAEILAQLELGSMQQLVAAHLSEKNNSPERALNALFELAPEMESRTSLLDQNSASNWFSIV